MLTRRATLRLSALAVFGLASASTLAACNDEPGVAIDEPDGSTSVKLVSSDVARAAGDPAAIDGVVMAMQALGGRVYGALASTDGNLAISPYSIEVALAMTLNGAGGQTAAEMRDVLGVSDLERFNGGVNALTHVVEGLAGEVTRADRTKAEVALASANALFGEGTTAWSKPFLDELARDYGAGMRTVDFIRTTEAARIAINKWTAKQTHDRIPEIIPAGILDGLTRLVLVNALYFKSPWETPFEKDLTGDKPFHLADGSSAAVPMMQGTAHSYGAGEGWQAVSLPYAGSALAMTVVVPTEPSLQELESLVADGGLGDVLASVRPETVELSLPKWTFRSQSPLKETLIALGMPTAFDEDDADFLAMTDNDLQLYISAVLHETWIAVDEDGTEAAAATAVVMSETSALLPGHTVLVDRPFLFVIHDVEHRTPLFLGRVADPTAG